MVSLLICSWLESCANIGEIDRWRPISQSFLEHIHSHMTILHTPHNNGYTPLIMLKIYIYNHNYIILDETKSIITLLLIEAESKLYTHIYT